VILSAIQGGVALLQATGRSEILRTALVTVLEPVIFAQRAHHAAAGAVTPHPARGRRRQT